MSSFSSYYLFSPSFFAGLFLGAGFLSVVLGGVFAPSGFLASVFGALALDVFFAAGLTSVVECPDTREFFYSTEAFPALTCHATILLGAVKGTSDVAFSVSANSILDFVGVLVNVDPVQERRVVADGSD